MKSKRPLARCERALMYRTNCSISSSCAARAARNTALADTRRHPPGTSGKARNCGTGVGRSLVHVIVLMQLVMRVILQLRIGQPLVTPTAAKVAARHDVNVGRRAGLDVSRTTARPVATCDHGRGVTISTAAAAINPEIVLRMGVSCKGVLPEKFLPAYSAMILGRSRTEFVRF